MNGITRDTEHKRFWELSVKDTFPERTKRITEHCCRTLYFCFKYYILIQAIEPLATIAPVIRGKPSPALVKKSHPAYVFGITGIQSMI